MIGFQVRVLVLSQFINHKTNTMARRGVKYKEDYISYWNSKGDYGKERVSRMMKRKKERYSKQHDKQYVRRRFGTWLDPYTGKRMQYCEWPEGSTCEFPCNGDC